jgi:hypothetical protein
MRLRSVSVTISLVLLSSAALAQQSPGTAGDTIGRPPPIPGPPAVSEPTTQPAPAASAPRQGEPAAKGYIGAYGPNNTPIPYSTGPLPQVDADTGLDKLGPDGSTRTVKAVPCGRFARETDGFTTCVGIPGERERTEKSR